MAVTVTEKKADCRVYLAWPERGESPLSMKPIDGLVHFVDAVLDTHPFWFGVVELPMPDRSLLGVHRLSVRYRIGGQAARYGCHCEGVRKRRLRGPLYFRDFETGR